MEYNLVHAMIGRFGVLIPLLGLFFELGALISGKKLVQKISGGIVTVGYIVVVLATITGFQEFLFLKKESVYIDNFIPHVLLSFTVLALFTIIVLIRIYLYKNVVEKLVILYFALYVFMVILNLFSNELIIRAVWEK